MTLRHIGTALRVSAQTVDNWADGKRPPSKAQLEALRELVR